MTTQAQAGFNKTVHVSTDGGNTYTKLGELREGNLKENVGTLNASSSDSAGSEEFIPGKYSWQLTGGVLYVEADAGQDLLYTVFKAKTTVRFKFLTRTAPAADKFEGDGFVTDWELRAEDNAPVITNFQVRGTGVVGKGAQ
jgi:predicted secreted protein